MHPAWRAQAQDGVRAGCSTDGLLSFKLKNDDSKAGTVKISGKVTGTIPSMKTVKEKMAVGGGRMVSTGFSYNK